MFIVLCEIPAKIGTCEQATKPQTNHVQLSHVTDFSLLQHNTFQKHFSPSWFPEFHSNSQVNDNWSIRKVTVKALILWERYRYTLFASQLVARPHSQGSLSKNSKQTILQGTKDNKTKKNIYSNLHTFAIWASLGVIRAGRNKDT